MERISEIGAEIPLYSYNKSFDGQTDSQKNSAAEDAVYTEISPQAKETAVIDKSKLLELLGPAVTEKYSDLIVSISKKNSNIQNFIEKVNKKLDLFA